MNRELGQLLLFVLLAGGLLAFLGVVVVMVMNQVNAQARRRRANLALVAPRWNARLDEGSWRPVLLFEVDGRPARLTHWPGAHNDPAWTLLEVQLPPPGGRLHVAPEGLAAWFGKLFGAEDIQVGDPVFDGAFVVQGHREEWVRSVLGPETRRHLQATGARLDVTAEGLLRVQVMRDLAGAPEALHAFLEHATAIARSMMASRPAAPASPTEAAATPVTVRPRDQGRCPVCADAIAAEAHRCGRCETAHHAECWEFIGGCAVFGCERSKPRDRTRAAPEAW